MILVFWRPGIGRRTARRKAMRSLLSRMVASISIEHRSVKTTQAYYCQKSLDTVNSEVLQALDDAVPDYRGTKNPLISQTDDCTGYA
jgi:hypothetical protein